MEVPTNQPNKQLKTNQPNKEETKYSINQPTNHHRLTGRLTTIKGKTMTLIGCLAD